MDRGSLLGRYAGALRADRSRDERMLAKRKVQTASTRQRQKTAMKRCRPLLPAHRPSALSALPSPAMTPPRGPSLPARPSKRVRTCRFMDVRVHAAARPQTASDSCHHLRRGLVRLTRRVEAHARADGERRAGPDARYKPIRLISIARTASKISDDRRVRGLLQSTVSCLIYSGHALLRFALPAAKPVLSGFPASCIY